MYYLWATSSLYTHLYVIFRIRRENYSARFAGKKYNRSRFRSCNTNTEQQSEKCSAASDLIHTVFVFVRHHHEYECWQARFFE